MVSKLWMFILQHRFIDLYHRLVWIRHYLPLLRRAAGNWWLQFVDNSGSSLHPGRLPLQVGWYKIAKVFHAGRLPLQRLAHLVPIFWTSWGAREPCCLQHSRQQGVHILISSIHYQSHSVTNLQQKLTLFSILTIVTQDWWYRINTTESSPHTKTNATIIVWCLK